MAFMNFFIHLFIVVGIFIILLSVFMEINFFIQLFIDVAIFIISLSVFIKIKYLNALNTFFINKKQKAVADGKKFADFKQKFLAVVGIVITVLIFLVLITKDLPNELNGLSHGITGYEYADLVLYAKSNDMTATVKEFKEYKKNGFETGRDFGIAKKMDITNIADYKKYKDEEFEKYKAEKNLADAKKLGFDTVEEMQIADKIENELKAQKEKEKEQKEKERLSIEADKRITDRQNQEWLASCKKYAEAKKQCAPAFNFDACVSRLGSSVAIYELNCSN